MSLLSFEIETIGKPNKKFYNYYGVVVPRPADVIVVHDANDNVMKKFLVEYVQHLIFEYVPGRPPEHKDVRLLCREI